MPSEVVLLSAPLGHSWGARLAFVSLAGAMHSDYLESQEEPALASRVQAQELILATLRDWVQGEEGRLRAVLEAIGADGHEAVWAF